jgi:hypothetical protein
MPDILKALDELIVVQLSIKEELSKIKSKYLESSSKLSELESLCHK